MALAHCPGWYCGRLSVDTFECGSCPRGFRRNDTTFICEPCLDTPTLYDWLYLGFMVLLELVLHWFFIDLVSKRRSFNKAVLILHFTAFMEILVSCIVALLFTHPFGTLKIFSCRVRSLADWYTLLHNPSPDYNEKVHCTQEAVYPLYTIVFVFYAMSLAIMLLIRPWVCRKWLPRQGKMSVYAAMYFIPILALIHALIGGLLYYAYPILVIIMSVISCAAHFAARINQSMLALVKTSAIVPRNVVILLGHWCLHAYGIISITQITDLTLHMPLLLLVPLPSVFYVLTSKFTDPNSLKL